jgi:hypothetical protein
MADILPNPEDVKKGVTYGNPSTPDTGEYIGETVIDVLTGRIIKPLNENDAIIV